MEREHRIDTQTLLAQAGWMRSLAVSLLSDAAAADDVVQDAAVAALRHPPAAGVPLEPWLSRVVRHFAWRRQRGEARRADREARATVPTPELSPLETLERLDLQQTLVDAVREIDEPLRTTLVLRYFEGRSSAEIARTQRVPAGTVRWRLKRGLELLRERLDARTGSRGSWMALLAPIALRNGAETLGGATVGGANILKGALAMSVTQFAVAAAAVVVVAGFAWWSFVESREPVSPVRATAAPVVAEQPTALEPETESEPARAPAVSVREAPARVTEDTGEPTIARADAHSAAQRFARVDVRFVDAHGVPWSGVRFSARPASYGDEPVERSEEATSGSDGRAELGLALPDVREVEGGKAREWKFEFLASRTGCATTARTATLRSDELAHLGDVVLLPGVRVQGRVIDGRGAGVDSAEVGIAAPEFADDEGRMRRHGSDTFDRSTSVLTTSDGSFALGGVAAGAVRLWAKAQESRYAWTEPLTIAGDRDLSDVELVLTPFLSTDRIAGRVVDPNGEPVIGANMTSMAHRGAHAELSTSLYSDDRGRFEVLVEHDDSIYDFTALTRDARWTPGSVEGVRPGTLDVVVALREKRELSVRLRDVDGRPVERGSFAVNSRYMSHTADATVTEPGEYHFTLPEQVFHLTASAPGFRSQRKGPFDAETIPAQLELVLRKRHGTPACFAFAHGRGCGSWTCKVVARRRRAGSSWASVSG